MSKWGDGGSVGHRQIVRKDAGQDIHGFRDIGRDVYRRTKERAPSEVARAKNAAVKVGKPAAEIAMKTPKARMISEHVYTQGAKESLGRTKAAVSGGRAKGRRSLRQVVEDWRFAREQKPYVSPRGRGRFDEVGR